MCIGLILVFGGRECVYIYNQNNTFWLENTNQINLK